MIEEKDLHPCPFCHGKASYDSIGSGKQACQIVCESCGCSLMTGEVEWSSGKAWNTRWGLIKHAKKSSAHLLLGRWVDIFSKRIFEVQMGRWDKNQERWVGLDDRTLEPTHYMPIYPPKTVNSPSTLEQETV